MEGIKWKVKKQIRLIDFSALLFFLMNKLLFCNIKILNKIIVLTLDGNLENIAIRSRSRS